jgi:O-antigen/teichoic acid export membrane protein
MGRPSGGIGFVALALVASGVLLNAYLAVVGRGVEPQDYLYFSAYWSLALIVGFGVFLPIEQELARLLHRSPDGWPAIRSGLIVAGGLAVVDIVLLLAGAPFFLPSLGHRIGMLAALLVFCIVSAGQFVLRGTLIGQGRMKLYAVVLVVDSVLRVGFAVALGAVWSADGADYAWTLVAAVTVAHFPLLVVEIGRARASSAPAGPLPAGAQTAPVALPPWPFAQAIGALLLGSLAAQLLLNGIPILVAATAGSSEQTPAGQFQAAFQLVRIPLFLAVPLQTTILPALASLFESGRRDVVRKVLTRFIALLAVVGVVGVLIGFSIGPWALRVAFGSQYDYAGSRLAFLSVGVTFYLGLVLVTQALVVAARHNKVAISWLAGLAAAAVVFAVVPDLVLASELSFVIGSGAGWLVGMTQLPVWNRHSVVDERI